MKQQKLFLDSRPGKQPEGTYPFGKNGIQFDLSDTIFNEPGFAAISAILPYTLMGIIETDSRPVLFSTNNTNSAIGFFEPVTGGYTGIINDDPLNLLNWPANGDLLGFKLDKYIKGEAQRNYKGELVVAFSDKTLFPMYLNCDAPVIRRLDDMRLLPINKPPTITLTESLGGTLTAGTYYVTLNYEKADGTTTQHTEFSDGITLSPGDIGTITDKAILITITNVDTNYDFVRVSIISKVGGKTKAIEFSDAAPVVGSTVEIFYSGDNLSTEVDVSELLTPGANYIKVNAIGQLNDSLYLGGLEKEPEIIDMQQYANLVTLKWKSRLINGLTPPIEHVNGTVKSFMHQEVYAFFIRYRKTRGGFTPAFILNGPVPTAGDLAASTESVAGGDATTIAKYKVEDTIHSFNAGTFEGECGVWQNDVEVYPNTTDFNSTSLGGLDLRGQKVRHFRMPTLAWCKTNLYNGVAEYGKNSLDLLGITPANITIPAKYIGIIDGYQILYARRTPTNQTVYGQSLMMHGAVDVPGASLPTGSTDIYTSGGNWSTSVWHNGKGDYNDDWELIQLRKDTLRFHSFDMLFNKPSIVPSFVSAQLRVRRQNLRTEGYLEDGDDTSGEMPIVHLVDYTLGTTPVQITAGNRLRKTNPGYGRRSR